MWKIIQNELVSKINAAKSFSVLIDETIDILHFEQLTFYIRYLDIVITDDNINYI